VWTFFGQVREEGVTFLQFCADLSWMASFDERIFAKDSPVSKCTGTTDNFRFVKFFNTIFSNLSLRIQFYSNFERGS